MNKSKWGEFLRSKKGALVLGLTVMFFWGSLFPMVKLGYKAFDVNTDSAGSILLFAGVRFVISGLLFMGVVGRRDRKLSLPDKHVMVPILMIALTAYVLHYTCTYMGLAHLESSKTAIIKQVGTLFIICFAFLFRKEDKFTWAKIIGGILGFASILVVNLNGLHLTFTAWDLLVVGAALCAIASTVFSKNAYDRYDPLYVTTWTQFIGGVVLMAVGLCLGGTFGKFDFASVGVMAYICFASCVGYGLWNILLKYHEMSKLSTIKFTETLFSAICSFIILGENIFRLEYLLSFVLVTLGVLIGNGTIKLKKAVK